MIMKVELLVTLKSRPNVWRKGTVLDSTKSPIPQVILNEVRLETGTVRVLEGTTEKPKIVVPETVNENETNEKTDPFGLEEETSNAITIDSNLDYLLTQMNATKLAKELGVSNASIFMWKSGRGSPSEENGLKLKELAESVKNDRSGIDSPPPDGS